MESQTITTDKTAAKEASVHTQKANETILNALPFMNKEDFENASRGLIAKLENPIIYTDDGRPVWDLTLYEFLKEEKSPDTVNASLWRQAKLNMFNGLFKVVDGIYQVRGYDLAVMSIIEGDTGYIVIDPMTCLENSKASMELVYKHLGKKPVKAMIYTHSHVDHFGGVKGVITQEQVDSGEVIILAPEGFLEEAISENVMAGNAMGRRASYMYGPFLPRGPKGQVDAGLGKSTSTGTVTLIPPTHIIKETGTKMIIDGVEIVFQMTPGTEAPAEMNFHFPQFNALCMAENCTHNLHNLYTLRGAKVRDAKAWAYYLNESIDLFCDKSDVVFASHHWPTWGKEKVKTFMKEQRDMYKYIHDETLRLANHGYTMIEIAEMIQLPDQLNHAWHCRGYYGSVSHDVKATYQRYLGWFDGNPANLHSLPPVEAGKKYVEYMGGADNIIEQARKDYEKGEYRWVAMVLNHVIFADPENMEARLLQADTLEQMGYQAESAPWRNFYLVGAMELRLGVKELSAPKTSSIDIAKAMTLDLFFDYAAVRLNGPEAGGRNMTFNFDFTDIKEKYVLSIENSVLNYTKGKLSDKADTSVTISRKVFDDIILGISSVKEKIESGELKLEGDPSKLKEFISLMDDFEFWFNIVTP